MKKFSLRTTALSLLVCIATSSLAIAAPINDSSKSSDPKFDYSV